MKKTITIEPFDEQMETMARSVDLLNRFKIAGMTVRKRFVERAIRMDPSMANLEAINSLNQFWLGRLRDAAFNERLESLLSQIAGELEEQLEKIKI